MLSSSRVIENVCDYEMITIATQKYQAGALLMLDLQGAKGEDKSVAMFINYLKFFDKYLEPVSKSFELFRKRHEIFVNVFF